MSYNPQNPNGQATSANSAPVVLASDQSNIGVNNAKVAGTTVSVSNGTTDAGTQRVTISSDSTGQVVTQGSVASGSSDSGNPVKVGGVYNSSAPTFTTGQRGDLQLDASGNLKVASTPSGTQTVSGTVTANAGTGNFSTNVAQISGSSVATAATGVQKVGVTDGTGNAITSTSNALDVNIKSGGGGGGGVSATDEAAWTAGTSTFTPTGGVFNDSATALTSGQQGTARLTNNRGLHTNLRNSAGTEIATSGNPVRIDPTGTTTQPVSGTVSVNALPTGTNSLGTVGLNAGTNVVGTVMLQDASGNSYFTTTADPGAGARGLIVRLPASTLTIGSVNLAPAASGGWSVSSQTALTAAATVSSAAGKFAGYMFINTNNSPAYIQVFDTTGAVTLGTTAPTFVVPIPAGGAANVEFTVGIGIANGIKVAATTTATGATTVATALTGFVLYK